MHTTLFSLLFFFFNDTATTEIYTLSLHDALPISAACLPTSTVAVMGCARWSASLDRKSTRLNSSHGYISYAVFCLKKKEKTHVIRSVSYRTPAHGACSQVRAQRDRLGGSMNLARTDVLGFRFIDSILFFFNDTATTEIYTLSLHDALPI